MKTLTGISLILVVLLVSLSAYLRLSHSGIGCSDWPKCYGQIGLPAVALSSQSPASAAPSDAYQKILESASQPLAWATPLHRLVASVLGLLVVFINVLALRQKRHRLVALALLALTVFLAVLGIRSGSLHYPAVIMGNLAGGFTLLGWLGWLWFRQTARPAGTYCHGTPVYLAILAIVLLATQVLLGGFTSANFAATACPDLLACNGDWWPGAELATALDLTRSHEVTPAGQAIGGAERFAIQQAHRLGALLAAAVILIAAVQAILSGGRFRSTGLVILLLLVLEFSVGIASVLSGLPITLAVAHNWLAALLLLSLLKLLSLWQGNSSAGQTRN